MTELPAGFQLDDLPEGFAPDRVNPMMPPNMGPKPPAPTVLQRFGQAAMPEGPAEAALQFATAGPASVLGGYAGMAGAALPGPEGQGRDWSQAVQNALTYQPRKPSGENIARVLGLPGEALAWAGNKVGDPLAAATGSPALGAGANAAVQAAPMLLPVGIKRARGAMDEARAGRNVEAMFDESQPAPVMEGPGFFERQARGLMQRAVKPTATMHKTGEAERAIGTMLEEGINPTKGGLEKLQSKIDAADAALSSIIENSTANVNVYKAALETRNLMREKLMQANPNADIKAIVKSVDEFINHPAVSEYIPVQLAQELKQGTYKSLRGQSYFGQPQGAATGGQAQAAIARGLKNEIAGAVPEVAPVNRQLSSLLEAQGVLEPRLDIAGNKNLIGLGSLSPKALNALIWLADRSPAAMGLAARGLYNVPRAAAGAVTAGQYGTLPAIAQESSETAAGK